AGSKVLIGNSAPDYNVLQWLVIYNVAAGVLSIGAAVMLWHKNKLSMTSAIVIFIAHTFVLVLLVTVFSEVAAIDSMKAMIFRSVIWITIIILSFKTYKNEI
ncbi:MAG: hypothetical protein DRI71_04140, partial [Bacteroidetes bacterium]